MSKKTTTIFSASAEQHPPCHDMQVLNINYNNHFQDHVQALINSYRDVSKDNAEAIVNEAFIYARNTLKNRPSDMTVDQWIDQHIQEQHYEFNKKAIQNNSIIETVELNGQKESQLNLIALIEELQHFGIPDFNIQSVITQIMRETVRIKKERNISDDDIQTLKTIFEEELEKIIRPKAEVINIGNFRP